jgi:hypothetical protein
VRHAQIAAATTASPESDTLRFDSFKGRLPTA